MQTGSSFPTYLPEDVVLLLVAAPGLVGSGHNDLFVGHDVLDLEVESLLGPLVDDQSGGREGVHEDPCEGEGVCGGLRLICHEEQQRFGSPLLECHLGRTGSCSLDVSGEGICEDILTRRVELHLLGDLGGLLEALPGGSVDILVVLSLVVCHVEVDVVADASDIEILYCTCFLGVLEDVPCSIEHRGVGPCVSND